MKIKIFPQSKIAQIKKRLQSPLKAKQFFQDLGLVMDRDTQITFRNQGQRSGMPRWQKFSQYTLHPSRPNKKDPDAPRVIIRSKWNLRPGTDHAKSRRYSASSKLLRASGGFQRSFRMIRANDRSLRFGTKHALAGKIGSNPERQVLFVTPRDERVYKQLFINFALRRMKNG